MANISKNNQTIVTDSVNIYENEYANLPRVLKIAKVINELRVIPRVFLLTYTIVFYQVIQWALAIENITIAQTGLVGVIAGMATGMFASYTMTSKNRQK